MAGMQGGERLAKIVEKWHALAQRRLAYIRELERNGRWKRYYTDEQFALCLRKAGLAVMLWSSLANGYSTSASGIDNSRPAA